MILKRVVLQNFLSHTDSIVEFNPNGITAIIGENGSGKSSIIEAIQFALFGDSDRGNLVDLIKWGKKEAVVELEFENQLGLFKIHREIIKAGKTASSQNSVVYKFEKGSFRPYYQKNLKTELPKLTGLTKKTFLTSGLIKQGEIEGLLSAKLAEREKIIEELLGIQYYQKLIEKYKDIKKTIKDKIDTLAERKPDIDFIDQQIKEKEQQLDEITKSLQEVDTRVSQAKAELEEVERSLEKIKEVKSKIELKETVKNKFISDLEKIKDRLSEIENLKQKLPQIQQKYQEYLELNQQLRKVQELESLTIRKNTLLEKLAQINQDIDFLENFEETAKKFKENQSNLQQLKKQLEDINTLLNTIEKKEIEKQNLEKQLSELEEELTFLTEFEKVALEYEEKQRLLDKLLEQINQISHKKGQINQIQEHLNNIDKDLSQKKEKLLQIAELLKQNYYQKFQTLKLNPSIIDEFINQNELKIQHLTKQKEDIHKELAQIQTEGKLYRQKVENLSSIDAVCPTCSRPINQHEKEELLKEINQTLEDLRKAYKEKERELKDIEKEIEKQNQIKTYLIEFKNLYNLYKEKESEKAKLLASLNTLKHQTAKLPDLEKEKQEVENFLKTYNAEYGRYKSIKQKKIEYQIQNIRQILREIEEFLEKNNRHILKEEKAKLEEEVRQIEQFISTNTANYIRYTSLNKDELLTTKQNILSQIKAIDMQIQECGISGDDINSVKMQINQKIELLKEYYDLYHQTIQKIKEEERLNQELSKTNQEVYQIEKEIEELQKQLEEIDLRSKLTEKERLTQVLESLTVERETINSEKVKLKTLLQQLKLYFEDAKKQIEEINQLKEKLQRYEKVIEALSQINRLIKDNALYMLPKITEEIFSRFNFSGFSGLKFDEKYSIVLPVNYPGAQINTTVDALSGGQRIALALALRFAISYMLNTRLEFLILDEPTIHMDRYRRRELVDLIGDLKEKNFVRQLIVVTHDEEIEERADTIYKVDAGQVELV